MCNLLTRAVVLALVLLVLATSPAASDPVCQRTDTATGQCLIWVEMPESLSAPALPAAAGPRDTGSGQSCYFDPSRQGLTGTPAGPVRCTSQYGMWSNTYNCYISPADPEPPGGDPSWQGHQPGDGAVYQCYQPQTDLAI